MLGHRLQIVIGVTVSLFLIIAYLHHSEALCGVRMANQPAVSTIPLKVTLSPSTSASSILGLATIKVSIANLSPHKLFILRWSSPLDAHVAAIGVFTFTTVKSNSPAFCLNMKFNHQLPTSGYFALDDERIITIPANGQIEKLVEFKEPEIALAKGEMYTVKAKGTWEGVWMQDNLGSDSSRLYLDDAELMRGGFESNDIVIAIPEETDAEL